MFVDQRRREKISALVLQALFVVKPAQTNEFSMESPGDSDATPPPNEPYSPEAIGTILLKFYRFLTTLHYDVADLKVPPPEGWPSITSERCAHFRSDRAIQVLRHLPYFDSKEYIHYKSRIIDYTSLTREFFESPQPRDQWVEISSADGEPVDKLDVVCIAAGHETHGRELFLNVKDGEITEDAVLSAQLDAVDIQLYFQSLQDAYRDLKLIPCPGRITIEAWDVVEREGIICEDQVRTQPQVWGTNLDVQYVRQVYRANGWPHAFQKANAVRAIESLLESMEGRRGEWEQTPEDWDQTVWR